MSPSTPAVLRLAHATPTALDYPEHDGRRVVWDAWRMLAPTSHITHVCTACEKAGEPWLSVGTVHPLEGEVFLIPTSDGPLPGPLRERPAWPVRRLYAYRCAACGEVIIYDTIDGADWREVPYSRPTLF
ncbi:hypothetical protein ACQP10_37965 (plasmid) [Streptosporangium sandarakinum]|uniref:hypothetical protein n=1 Tax=Streptosporangium sandarakinum TaxID=1260955 RepID=UPI003D8C0C21